MKKAIAVTLPIMTLFCCMCFSTLAIAEPYVSISDQGDAKEEKQRVVEGTAQGKSTETPAPSREERRPSKEIKSRWQLDIGGSVGVGVERRQ